MTKLQSIITRLRDFTSFSQILTLVNVSLVITGAWLAGDLAALVIERQFLQVPFEEARYIPPKITVKDTQRPFSAFSAIIDNNVFNASIKSETTPQIVDVEEEKITAGEVLKGIIDDLTLLGIHYRKDHFIFAVIKSKKKKEEEVFTIGDEVFDTGVVVKRIFTTFNNQRVLLQLGNEVGVLTYESETEQSTSSKKVALSKKRNISSKKDSSIKDNKTSSYSTDGKNFHISATEVDTHLNDFGSLLNQARMVPYFKNGKHQGFKVKAIDKGSLYQKLGLKNNDIISAVNGESLADAGGEKLMGLFKLLRNEREFTVEIQRSGKSEVLNYYVN